MKYVKLTVTNDNEPWFEVGTELWDHNEYRRITLEEFDNGKGKIPVNQIIVSGIRKPKLENEIKIFGDKYRIDGELENFDNINIEITEGDGVEEIKKLIEKYI